jgi:uncharacterized protein (TIGR03083 family)
MHSTRICEHDNGTLFRTQHLKENMIPIQQIDTLEATFLSLSNLGRQLSEEQWKLPTDCPGWSVQDNLSHLVGIEVALSGGKPTSHKSPKFDYIKNAIGEHNENEIDVRRSQSGAQVLEEWNSVSSNRITQLRAADDAYFETPMMMPTGPGTLGDFLGIRILDCWVHEQDMRRATGIAGNEGGPAAEHTIDRLTRTLPIVVGKRAATPEGASVVFVITGSVQRNIPITVISGRATIVTAPPAEVLCTVQLDSNAFTALATGRQTADQLANRLQISGDNDLGQRVVTQLNMMI